MDHQQTAVAIIAAAISISIAALFFYLWMRSRELRDALKGQDGHRLMVIFTNLFLIDGLVMANAAVRSLLVVLWPDTSILRALLAIVGWFMFVGIHAWVLLSIRALVNRGRSEPIE